ncbi:MAG: aminoacyl-tRNA hydrolase [Phycisphaerales bacterium]|nr:aminoacyl-tRNA hydrolase [Phycisphaerae bacterium]NNF43241.1 aminoacyl-tRNA hydrolase [Phycisphaerales bacterium]NNM27548.1 aminoacyl-tRNA hydrolase [Phycisphaerales bacterium]
MSETVPPEESPSTERLAPGVWVARNDLRFTFTRSQGPGGQAVNKLSTAAQLRVPVDAIRGLDERALRRLRRLAGRRLTADDEIMIQSQESRSQLKNRQRCMERLRSLVLHARVVPKIRKKTKPSRAMIQRRLDAKRRLKEKKSRRRWEGD